MFAMLGFELRDDLMLDAEIEPLIDLDNGDLRSFAQEMRSKPAPQSIDQRFRMRAADGNWICMRARGELIGSGGNGGKRMVGIVVDETEERRVAEQAKQARQTNERIRDAI